MTLTIREHILAKHPGCWRQLDRIPDDLRLLTEFSDALDDGTDPVWAEMSVCRCGPVLKTETSYATQARFGSLSQQFGDDAMLAQYVKGWEAKGVRVTGNEVWLPHLAKSPDDVSALAPPGEVLSRQKRLAEERGIGLEGAVNVKPRDAKEPKAHKPKLGYDIVTRYAKEKVEKEGRGLIETPQKKRELYDRIVDEHAYKP